MDVRTRDSVLRLGSNKIPVKRVAGTKVLSQFRFSIVQRTRPMWSAKAVSFSGM